MAAAVLLVQAGKQDEALEFLKTQPRSILRSARVQTSLAALEEERTQALFRTVGRAYAGLESDLAAGEAVMRHVMAATAKTSLFGPIGDAYRARGQAVADRVVGDALGVAKSQLRDHNREGAGQALQSVFGILDYANPDVKMEWHNTQRRAAQTSLISRFRS